LSEIRFVRCLVDTDVIVGQRVTLSCETSEDVATVDWLKNDEHLSRDDGCHGYEMSDSGRVHSLTILAAALSDEAKYTCSCRDDVTSGLVLVEGTSGTTSYLRSSYTYKTEKCLVCVCVSVYLLSVLRSFCMTTVLNGSARNLARGILTVYRWSWGLASAARERALALGAPSIRRCK